MTDNKIDEMLRFLKFSFKNKNDKFSFLFELFTDDIEDITRIISIRINDKDLVITKEKQGTYDSKVILKQSIFIDLYSSNLSAFGLFRLLFKSKDIKTTNLSISKFRKFVSKFDFSSKSWDTFYLNEKIIIKID